MVSVNEDCIACGICWFQASSIFSVEGWISHVIKQPETQEEKDAVKSAIEACPVAAIQE
jgi:ferredoxin